MPQNKTHKISSKKPLDSQFYRDNDKDKFFGINYLEYFKMAGNKNSGRRNFVEDWKSKKACNLAVDILIRGFESPDNIISLSDKMSKAIPIVSKCLPEKIEIEDVNSLTYEDKIALVRGISKLAGLLADRTGQAYRQATSIDA